MLLRLVEFLILAGGVYFLFRVAKKAWRRSELHNPVEEKLEQLEEEKELADKVVDINIKEVNRNRKKLNDFEDL